MKTDSKVRVITESTHQLKLKITRERGAGELLNRVCPHCAANLLTINEAVNAAGRGWTEIVHLLNADKVHAVETARGEIFVCLRSLLTSES